MPGQKLTEAAETLTNAGFTANDTRKALDVLFVNGTSLSFSNISSEEYREYVFPGGEIVKIESPLQLNVSKNGHRLFDAQGVSHYVPQGWIHLRWKVKSGQPNFVK